jgi:hypothetical protein
VQATERSEASDRGASDRAERATERSERARGSAEGKCVRPRYLLLPPPHPFPTAPFLLCLATFFCCIYSFPLRIGCSQSYFNVATHLSFLLISFVLAGYSFCVPFSPKKLSKKAAKESDEIKTRMSKYMIQLNAAGALVSAVGLFHWIGQFLFLVVEVLITFVFVGWEFSQVKINLEAAKGLPLWSARLIKWGELAVYAACVGWNAGSVGVWLEDPFSWSSGSWDLYVRASRVRASRVRERRVRERRVREKRVRERRVREKRVRERRLRARRVRAKRAQISVCG